MAFASSASVSQFAAFVVSPQRVQSTPAVSVGIHKFSLGCSSSQFLASEKCFSFVPLKAGDKSVHVKARSYKQNEELPPSSVSRRVKKPFLKPIKHGSHQKRMRNRELRQLPPRPLKAPANGMVVEKLIPLAHSVYEAYLVVLKGVARLMKHLPVKACRWCSEIHVAKVGHDVKSCFGKNNSARYGQHLWVPGYLDDVVVPIEAFHLKDRMQKPILHDDRFNHDRIPAIVELCIQAGLDLPEFPTLRRTTPIDNSARRPRIFGSEERALFSRDPDSGGSGGIDDRTKPLASDVEEEEEEDEEEEQQQSVETEQLKRPIDGEESRRAGFEVLSISDDDDLKTVAEKTLLAWDQMRSGATRLMATYPVRACGYCPEVHIGRRGHKLQLCGAFKHQWRNGQHGWQDSALDDLIPPRFVWHVRDVDGPPLKNEFANFYGKAPAVVELCVQAGADVPSKYIPYMRLDVIIPDDDELEMVA